MESFSQGNGLIIEPPKLSSDDNFSIWKNRMIGFLNTFHNKLVETIKEGRDIPLREGSKCNDEDKEKVNLDYMAMHILSVSLPDDIYRFVMNCKSAKEMWDNLILLFEGTNETTECRRSLLIRQYELFTCKPGESLTQTFIRFKCLINDLRQHGKSFDNDEILIKFLRSLPMTWNTMCINIRHTNNLKTMSLESLYGILLTHELETKHNASVRTNFLGLTASMKEEVVLKNEGYYKAKYHKLKAEMKSVAKEVMAETSKEVVSEESDDDMGFSLFD